MNVAKLVFGILCALPGIGLVLMSVMVANGVLLVGHPYGWQKDEVLELLIGGGLVFVSLVALGTRSAPARVLPTMAITYGVTLFVFGAAAGALAIRGKYKHANACTGWADDVGDRPRCEKHCSAGDAQACGAYAANLWKTAPRDAARARVLSRTACDAGEPRGCWVLSQSLLKGDGGPKDSKAGVDALVKACDTQRTYFSEHTDACDELERRYREGDGVAKDANEAKRIHTLGHGY